MSTFNFFSVARLRMTLSKVPLGSREERSASYGVAYIVAKILAYGVFCPDSLEGAMQVQDGYDNKKV